MGAGSAWRMAHSPAAQEAANELAAAQATAEEMAMIGGLHSTPSGGMRRRGSTMVEAFQSRFSHQHKEKKEEKEEEKKGGPMSVSRMKANMELANNQKAEAEAVLMDMEGGQQGRMQGRLQDGGQAGSLVGYLPSAADELGDVELRDCVDDEVDVRLAMQLATATAGVSSGRMERSLSTTSELRLAAMESKMDRLEMQNQAVLDSTAELKAMLSAGLGK